MPKIFASAWASSSRGSIDLVVGVAEDFGRGVDQFANDRLLADDLGVPDGVGRGRHAFGDVEQERHAAEHLEIARAT